MAVESEIFRYLQHSLRIRVDCEKDEANNRIIVRARVSLLDPDAKEKVDIAEDEDYFTLGD